MMIIPTATTTETMTSVIAIRLFCWPLNDDREAAMELSPTWTMSFRFICSVEGWFEVWWPVVSDTFLNSSSARVSLSTTCWISTRLESIFFSFFGRIILNRLAGGSVTKKLDELETNWNSRTCFLRCASGDKSIRRGKLASSYPLSNYVIWVGNAAVSINNLNTLKEAQRLFQFLPVPPRYHGCKPTVNKSNHFYSIRRTGETNLVYKFYKSSRTKKKK